MCPCLDVARPAVGRSGGWVPSPRSAGPGRGLPPRGTRRRFGPGGAGSPDHGGLPRIGAGLPWGSLSGDDRAPAPGCEGVDMCRYPHVPIPDHRRAAGRHPCGPACGDGAEAAQSRHPRPVFRPGGPEALRVLSRVRAAVGELGRSGRGCGCVRSSKPCGEVVADRGGGVWGCVGCVGGDGLGWAGVAGVVVGGAFVLWGEVLVVGWVCGRVGGSSGGPGGGLLSRVLRRSTIGAGGFHDRVRNGIGWGTPAWATGSTGGAGGVVVWWSGARSLARLGPVG